MTPLESKELRLLDRDGREGGILRLALLPDAATTGFDPLIDAGESAVAEGLERIQLLEGHEYVYTVVGVDGAERLEPAEVMARDDRKGLRGRLRPGLNVGRLALTVTTSSGTRLATAVEVRSRKLDYLKHYRWMLRDLTDAMTEVVMRRFGASEQRFETDSTRDPATLYQRYALLRSVLEDGTLDAAMGEINERPHRQWIRREEAIRPGRGVPAGSYVARQLVRPGPRRPWSTAPPDSQIKAIPMRMFAERPVETLDTAENRFVRFALERWRSVLTGLRDGLVGLNRSAPEERGKTEVDVSIRRLEAFLHREIFADVGPMQQLPAGSQVLHRREGYREVFRLYLAFESAALLTWTPDDSAWRAGQRDVATLYEYWVYLRLAALVGRLGGNSIDLSSLLVTQPNGLSVQLRRGEESSVSGTVERRGRRFNLELHFNRRFGGVDAGEALSWTRGMRPDCSLKICPEDTGAVVPEAVWIHFDAKYRVEEISELLGDEKTARRDDLLKMHAYRDAIRRTAGAYVVYPGTDEKSFRQFHEILPGLGAFPMRPNESGHAIGEDQVERFLADVIDHMADETTSHERWRFWTREVFEPRAIQRGASATPLREAPPADLDVLIGTVRSAEHLEWVRSNKKYNLRADGREGSVHPGAIELSAGYALLHGEDLESTFWQLNGTVEVLTHEQMVASGYPDPRGSTYLVVGLTRFTPYGVVERMLDGCGERLRKLHAPDRPKGAPFVVTWLDLLIALEPS